MGRKKIEIRPLTDERNRNVTFLKRKAGLMKKAWELSVLCAADVSIMIFSSQGKAYEFSSKDLDSEIDKYLEYEGLIERRRAEEFAAMAAAGEDDEDDEDEPPRRGSVSKPGVNGTGAPTKSLKGKESFKARQASRSEIGRAVARAKEGKRGKRDKRVKRRDERGSRSFIEGLLSDDDSSDDDSERGPREREREDRKRRRRDDAHHSADNDQPPQGIAGLNYALSMHQAPPPMAEAEQLSGFFAHMQPGMQSRPNYRMGGQLPAPSMSNPYDSYSGNPMSGMPDTQMAYHGGPGHNSHNPTHLPGNMQWDPQLVARFAEYQMQQNHQKQQRVLLERQRAQLAEMGIPIDDRTLLDQIFGNGPVNSTSPLPQAESHESGAGGGCSGGGGAFEWPSVNRRTDDVAPKDEQEPNGHGHSAHAHAHGQPAHGHPNGGQGYGYPHYASASTSGSEGDRRYEPEHIPWGVGGVPTPDSPSRDKRRTDEGMYDAAMEERRRRTVLGLPM